jgi:hypothetical protein
MLIEKSLLLEVKHFGYGSNLKYVRIVIHL